MTLQIIGAGFGRTGTLSLKYALENLGFSACYHMEEVFAHPWHARTWLKACRGQPLDWDRLLHGYRATVDWPACAFYPQLMQRYPQARVILSTRDPESWYDSVAGTIYPVMGRFPLNPAGRFLPGISDLSAMLNCIIWEGTFQGRFSDRQYAIQVFNQHNAEVIRRVPPERLLVYDVREGWEPLCRFLQVPAPAGKPFPHANDRQAYRRRVDSLMGLFYSGMTAALMLAGAGLIWWASKDRKV
jgi:hypothetical protein